MALPADRYHHREILFEFRPMGRHVRVSAIDVMTGTEIHVVGDARQGQETMKRVAINKLRYVLAKKAQQPDSGKR